MLFIAAFVANLFSISTTTLHAQDRSPKQNTIDGVSHETRTMSSSNYVSTGQARYLRACMVCSIVMTYARFRDEGCPNCEEFLHLQHSQDQIESCTSQVFEGVITLANPAKSWIAKYQRLDNYVPGMYAIKVSGQLPDEIRSTLEDEYRIQYIPRDGTEAENDA
ncbi:hypothetical protein BFJ70_g12907 [Fusarium oxysporum]|uniref:Transcription elongation factor SPT4 n=20 Tax=Fusarium oxysporum species complex TaxID=171631 RepID=N1RKZ5_FUSC4|nr:transcription elongation factor SPT4 [Fusarium oxysporum Fo47]EGU77343.1 hypothetical protein FOXB_12169 [Fusarium oxysporum f. sp. conglutinans Fo5176]EMT65042.1 Transcription elongation factor spt-4 [Fusarium odoratissimum]KAF5262529.1 hypothetical protein FOXYS1_6747 [Fusarium oxysporum]KAG7435900.1 Transcription elongation factor SPT4 [Fusarium oxysporum f. sp. raphani]KAH7490426.1 hypothetical protein FOMA001_g3469 [Fusarium oxysporum f. sp. matthiolae]KAK2131005.1 Spt4/RpoE2 zinc fin